MNKKEEQRMLLWQALDTFKNLIKPDNKFGEHGEYETNALTRADAAKILDSLNEQLRIPFIFIASIFGEYTGHPKIFRKIANDKLSPEDWKNYGTSWYILHVDNGISDAHFQTNTKYDYGPDVYLDVLLTVMEQGPQNSSSVIKAANEFLDSDLSELQIDNFRNIWELLPSTRREAIVIGINEKIDRRLSPNKLELITRGTRFSVDVHLRKRWVDYFLPQVRHVIWSAVNESCYEFVRDIPSLGDERGQVGGLLSHIGNSLKERASLMEAIIKNGKRPVSINFNRYTFSSKEESNWGADFVMIYTFKEENKIVLQRYILFQAKLLSNNKIKVDINQFKQLIRTSWHGSFYITWSEDFSPKCIPASLLDDYLSTKQRDAKHKPSNSKLIDLKDIGIFSDGLPALLADRFFTGELGEPLGTINCNDKIDLKNKIIELIGLPKYGLLNFDINIKPADQVSDFKSSVIINTEPQFIE